MFDLENVAHCWANHLLKDTSYDDLHKAKIEYGIALALGVTIELVFTVGIALLLDTVLFTLLMMISALILRIFTG